ncbi:MAG: hypothetical protein JW920_00955 [Deltaproteobacteria bacterium]|nr:hypothetical protein [Deltaproteobacteria bacterium]
MQILKKIRKLFNLLILSPFVLKLLIKAFKIPASTGKGSNLCLENGYLALPVNYYSPVPEIKDLAKRRVWDKRSEMRGIDLNINSQQQLLLHIGRSFAEECAWPLLPTENPCDFYLQNQSFSYGCAASTHGIIRYFKPRRVIEI